MSSRICQFNNSSLVSFFFRLRVIYRIVRSRFADSVDVSGGCRPMHQRRFFAQRSHNVARGSGKGRAARPVLDLERPIVRLYRPIGSR